MAKIGRNQPCPCGSGKKYKHCCFSKDQAARAQPAAHTEQHLAAPSEHGFFLGEDDLDDLDDLDELSNRVVDLINEGRLEEAETACQELKQQYPEAIDWIQRTAMLHEARGETHKAIEYYERTLRYMDAHPEDFEELSREPVRTAIARLQQPPDAPS